MTTSAVPAPAPVRCEVWWARLDHQHERLLSLLDAVELWRRANYRRSQDRARFTVGAALLRLASARMLGRAPHLLTFGRECPDCKLPHGRPRLRDGHLHVSVSHSGDLIAVAVSTGAEMGVDVETVDESKPARLARRVLDPAELARFQELPESERAQDFFRVWTRKEAVLKATGEGLRLPMNAVGFDRGGRLTAYPGRPDLPGATHMFDLHPRPCLDDVPDGEYRAALAVLSPSEVRVEQFNARGLLHTW
ncbi:4'-phosphopantetheinyl transferase superfamily protein [Streptomyces sp. MST-110588]|uniref:4'-phosphopantetheinyl transferase family protein n=1 Tax=Streptomyces sp. MST-110588 TaxID=2833628 RepID=UPI001F5C7FEE|nr:4'-phosphopantetheinyl transferase superfamily protein [Streptomyces sp. MST-110588]UNO40787.1 4'-phosphopantetheinyl transferase superfamily protein [Streptomyces sp. MST-110588]